MSSKFMQDEIIGIKHLIANVVECCLPKTHVLQGLCMAFYSCTISTETY